jgi:multimeric flavodoxin WrbA
MNPMDNAFNPMENRNPGRLLVTGVGGSPRKAGNSDILVKQMLKGAAEQGVSTRFILLREYQYQGCIGCEKCRQIGICTGLKDGMSLIYNDIIEAKGLILVSPTHHYNITAWMKSFIDRLYCFYRFDDHRPRGWSSRLAGQGRKALLCAVCEQNNASDMGFTLKAMRYPLEALGYEIVDELPVFGIFDRGRVKEQNDLMKKAKDIGRNFARLLAS